MCQHDFASGVTKYDRQAHRLSYEIICDGCGVALRQIEGEEYTPVFALYPPAKPV